MRDRPHLAAAASARASGPAAAQYIDVERCATTPERFLQAVIAASPFPWHGGAPAPTTAREAFDVLLTFFDTARAPGGEPCTFLLDEVLELRTFESFPGLRHVLRDLIEALAASPNRFVLTTRYVARAHRLLRDATARFEVMHQPALTAARCHRRARPGLRQLRAERRQTTATISDKPSQALTDGRAAYVKRDRRRDDQRWRGCRSDQRVDGAAVGNGGVLSRWCRFCYELRLHRARGYGALKAILDILAEEESLTLTEISLRLRRTPGSTKDYLSWLEDVDLVVSRQKQYSFTDPLLRLWVPLVLPTDAANDDEVAREVQRYALARVPSRRGRTSPCLCGHRRDARRAQELGNHRNRLMQDAECKMQNLKC